MELSGGSWMWSSSLRYIFMVPFLIIIVASRKNIRQLFVVMREHYLLWFVWSFVGFVLFYAPICFAASYAPGWLTAGTWQFTIIAGSLLAPLFKERLKTAEGTAVRNAGIPLKSLFVSFIILLGIIVMQIDQAQHLPFFQLVLGTLPVLVASFAYPLGNRKMMSICGGRLDTYQRVLGMTLSSLPWWIGLSIAAFFTAGPPTPGQTMQALLVAVSSGVIATVLFFRATEMVRLDMQKLAAVEATQSMEVLFTVIGEVLFLSIPMPSLLSWSGIVLIMIGILIHSYMTHRPQREQKQNISI
jgi:drug/metabolite transporter (DMT)-like permease